MASGGGALRTFVSTCLLGWTASTTGSGSSGPGTLEDIYGDTGRAFQGAIGMINFEGQPGHPAQQSYGIGIDDMYVEWREFTLDPDHTSCATGNCAVLELPATNVFEGNNVLQVSLLEATPYGSACVGGPRHGLLCLPADPDCSGGSCLPAYSDCNLDGNFRNPGDDTDCNNNGTPDVVARATSEVDVEGVILFLDQQGGSLSHEYRAKLSVSIAAKSPGTLFLAQQGTDAPTVTVTYLDHEDGTGHVCQNSVVPAQQGLVRASTSLFVPTCDIALASVSFTDNGDGDPFADTEETVSMSFAVRNNCGFDLTGCSARLSTNSPWIECIQRSQVMLGTLSYDAQAPPIEAPLPFEFKVSAAADRNALGLDAEDSLAAALIVSFTCNEIDANSSPQETGIELDLTFNDHAQTPMEWKEGFESATFGKFSPENNDAGIPGNSDVEGLANGDGWRCQFSNPDWVNGNAYGHEAAFDCYPGGTLAQANAVFWKVDGLSAPHVGPKRAYRGSHSLYYGVWLTDPAGEFTTPLSVIEGVRTTEPINLGVDNPRLSFWHQISLADHRLLSPMLPLRSSDRGVVQIQIADAAGQPASEWMRLEPFQNAYDEQAADHFFYCQFDPVDDGTTEDDFFDPTDPNRREGPSSTCYPEFTFGYLGDTDGPFQVGIQGNETTPPAASDSPSLGPGSWVESVIDLSVFRARRVRLRFLVSAYGVQFLHWEHVFPYNPYPEDDGWWIDDVVVDETLAEPADLVNDRYVLKSCLGSGAPCIAQCSQTLVPCSADVPCGAGAGDCISPCPSNQSCTGPAPGCTACAVIFANVVAETTTQSLLNPLVIETAAPGQVVTFDAAEPTSPSAANACPSGGLQYLFCRSADPDGGGAALPDGDCNDTSPYDLFADDVILRDWTENPVMAVAPKESAVYVTQIRCSTAPSCVNARRIEVRVLCPGGVNALALTGVRAQRILSTYRLAWAGPPLAVDTWTSLPMQSSSGFVSYPGTTTNSTALVTSKSMNEAVLPGQLRGYLVKADGPLNTIPLGYYCNSRTWRSGDAAEIPEGGLPPGRDESLGNP